MSSSSTSSPSAALAEQRDGTLIDETTMVDNESNNTDVKDNTEELASTGIGCGERGMKRKADVPDCQDNVTNSEENGSDNIISRHVAASDATATRSGSDSGQQSCHIEHSSVSAMAEVFDSPEIMILIFTFLPIKEQGKNKLVCKQWESLNTQSIEASPKMAFGFCVQLRMAVLIYCNQGGRVFYKDTVLRVTPPTRSKRQMIFHLYGNVINDWNVSKIEDFDSMFKDCEDFNDKISSWNTSNAKTMRCMFDGATSFNQPLNGWNTFKVKNMNCMFRGARSFNQPLNGWNTSNVEDLSCMFEGARSFNGPINDWNTSNVEDMDCMFNQALSFNQPLDGWNTHKVKNMANMFVFAPSFNQPLNGWNTSNVEKMECMFRSASAFNQPLNGWNTSNVESMHSMFRGASSFNQPLNGWNTSNVEDMNCMFAGASSFNQPLNEWNTSNVKCMRGMFQYASAFSYPIDMWDTSAIENQDDMPLGHDEDIIPW